MRMRLSIALARYGCANRPFYYIAIMNRKVIPKRPWEERTIEQIGSYDPLPNKNNEKMVAINYERLRYWLANNAKPSQPVAELLGLAGFLPIFPRTLLKSQRNRAAAAKKQAELAQQKSDTTNTEEELNSPPPP